MKIDIAKSELQALRGEVFNRLAYLRNTPAARTPSSYHIVATEIALLQKFIRKINRALKAAYGHDCGGSYYA